MAKQNDGQFPGPMGEKEMSQEGPLLRPKKASSGSSSDEELHDSYTEELTPDRTSHNHQESNSAMNPQHIQPSEMMALSESMQGAYGVQHGQVTNTQTLTESDYQHISATPHEGVNLDGQVQSFHMHDADKFEGLRENSINSENEGSLDEAGHMGHPVGEHQLSAEEEFNHLHDSEVDYVSQSENAEADQYLEMESAESDQFHQGSHNFEEESSQRYEPEGQYQGAYDRNLPGAQGYAPVVMPPGGYGQAPIGAASQDRHEPVRQWVLNIDPNPNPEDDQIIDISFSSDHGDRYGFPGAQNSSLQRAGLSNSDPDLARRNAGVVNRPNSVARIGGQGASSGDLARADVLGQSQNSTVNMPGNSSYHNMDDGNHFPREMLELSPPQVIATQTDNWVSHGEHDSMEAETQTSTLGMQDQSVGTDWAHLVVRQEAGPGQASTQPQSTHTATSPPIVASSHRSSSHGDGSVHSTLGASQQSLLSNQGSAGSSVQAHKNISGTSGSLKLSQQSLSHPVTVSKVMDKNHSLSQNTMDSGIGDSQLMSRTRAGLNKVTVTKQQSDNRHIQCVQKEGNTDMTQRQTPQGAIPKQKPLPASKTNKTVKTVSTGNKSKTSNSKLPQKQLTLKSSNQQQHRLTQGQQKNAHGHQQKETNGTHIAATTHSRPSQAMNESKKPVTNRQVLTGDSRSAGGGSDGIQKTGRMFNGSLAPKNRSPQGQKNVPSMSQHMAEQGINISPIKPEDNRPKFTGHYQASTGGSQRVSFPQTYSQKTPPHSTSQASHTSTFQQSNQLQLGMGIGGRQAHISDSQSSHNVEAVEQILSSMASNTSEQVSTLQSFNCSSDIDNMAQVREHLQAILHEQPQGVAREQIKQEYGNNVYKSQQKEESRQGYIRGNTVGQDSRRTGHLDAFHSESSAGSFEQMLAYSAKYFTPESQQQLPFSQQPEPLNIETKFWKDSLEKEQFRRKHCEELIQDLQRKQLENQEQLAVAVEMDRKKDHMIHQLDKTLAVVVEKWKKGETERVTKMSELQTENERLKQSQHAQEQVAHQLEIELKNAIEKFGSELQKMKEIALEREEQLRYKTEECHVLTQELQLQRSRNDTLSSECQGLNERLDKLNLQFARLKEAYDEENMVWEEKEKEYLQKIEDITENHMKLIEEGKERLSNQSKAIEEKDGVLTATQKHNKELEIELDTLAREKESLKVQVGLLEAKFESNHRKLQAEFMSEMESKLSEQEELLKKQIQDREEELRERHKQQVYQLNTKHNRDTESQMAEFRSDLQKREDRYRDKERQLQDIVSELKGEVEDLKESIRVHEAQRNELASKLPAMMQAHCNEALRMLQQGQGAFTMGSLYNPALLPEVTPSAIGNSLVHPSSNSAVTASRSPQQTLFTMANHGRTSVRVEQSHPSRDSRPGFSQAEHDVSLFSALSEGVNASDVSGISEAPSNNPVSEMLRNLLSSQGQHSRFTEGIHSSLPANIHANLPSMVSVPTSMNYSNKQQQSLHSNSSNLDRNVNTGNESSEQQVKEPVLLNLKPVQYDGTLRAHRDIEDVSSHSIQSYKMQEKPYEKTSIQIHFKDDMELASTQNQNSYDNTLHRHYDGGQNTVNNEHSDVNKPVNHVLRDDNTNISLHFDRDLVQNSNNDKKSNSNVDSANSMFHNLSAQNHQGMEFIRKQIEEQRTENSSVIQLHPPVQLDLSELQAAHTLERQQLQPQSGGSSGSDKTQQKVTWRLADSSFDSTNYGKEDTREEVQPLHLEEVESRSVDYSDMAQRFDQHENRQAELQRYIKMLLHKPPSSPVEESEIQSQQQGPQSTGLSPSQMGEISRLVGMYKQTEQVNQDMQDVLSYLKEAQENRYEQPEQPGTSPPSPPRPKGGPPESPRKPLAKARRNLEATYKVANAKQVTKPLTANGNNEKVKQSNVPSLKPTQQHPSHKTNGSSTSKAPPPKKVGQKKSNEKSAPVWK